MLREGRRLEHFTDRLLSAVEGCEDSHAAPSAPKKGTMDTRTLETFAQAARRQLLDQVAARLEHVLGSDSVEVRVRKKALEGLLEQIDQTSKQAVIEKAAYTWFNRFCALRFMDVNHYTRVGVVSPLPGFTQPEILADAKQGVIDPSFPVEEEQVHGLLSGQIPSSNPQQEAYRLLLVAACQAYHRVMPFLFDPIEDETQLLMPDDLLSENAVLQGIRDTLTPEVCQDVEVIGWLYQFYISEKKDEVIGSKGKIQAEEIPAATQLFTPHWIVRYLVENSLGRLWMLNNPTSRLVDQMDYYIQPEGEEDDFLRIESPEEIKVCDPACGSGHMLTYAFDLLYAIYAEQGYDPVRIPELILKNNLYGIEIDERAGDLAGFALMMKARGARPPFLPPGGGAQHLCFGRPSFHSRGAGAIQKSRGQRPVHPGLVDAAETIRAGQEFRLPDSTRGQEPGASAGTPGRTGRLRGDVLVQHQPEGQTSPEAGRVSPPGIPCCCGQPALYGQPQYERGILKQFAKIIIPIAKKISLPCLWNGN